MQSLYVAPIFIFLQASFYRLTSGKRKRKEKTHTMKREKNPSIDRSLCESICKFPPPLLPQLTPVPFPFLQFSPPPVLIPSFLPAPSFISHLSAKLLQDRVWTTEER